MSANVGLPEAVGNMTAYVSELWRLRHFWMALVRNDLRSRYRVHALAALVRTAAGLFPVRRVLRREGR